MVITLWSRWDWPIISGRTRHLAPPIPIVLGTIPLAVNQGAELVTGNMDAAPVLRALANYMTYVLSSIGVLSAYEQPGSPPREVSSS